MGYYVKAKGFSWWAKSVEVAMATAKCWMPVARGGVWVLEERTGNVVWSTRGVK